MGLIFLYPASPTKQIIVKSKGKKYRVNVPWFDSGGGPSLLITDFIWLKYGSDYYRMGLVTDGGFVTFFIDQTPESPSQYFFNYITLSLDGNTYKVELTFDSPIYTLSVGQTPLAEISFPYIVLRNITDGNRYKISLVDDGGLIGIEIDQTAYE